MTVTQLIETLQSLPEEAKQNQIMVQTETKGHAYTAPLTQIYCVQQNQYTSKIDGMVINQEMYDQLKDVAPNDFFLVKQDFDLMCPVNTTFIYSNIVPEETPQPEPSKADLVRGSIIEGSIPHLRLETD